MKSSVAVGGGFWLGGYISEYRLEAPIPKFHLPLLVDACIKEFLPGPIIEGQTVTDLKGRDPRDMIQNQNGTPDAPSGDELLYIAGDQFTIPDDIDPPEQELVPQPFSIRVNTVFAQFVGAHHISHRLEIKRSSRFPESVPLTAIGRVFPLHLKSFRLGLNFFQSRRLPAFFGFAPTVDRTLLMEADEELLFLKIRLESLKSRNNLPPAAHELLSKLNPIMCQVFNFNLVEDYSIKSN